MGEEDLSDVSCKSWFRARSNCKEAGARACERVSSFVLDGIHVIPARGLLKFRLRDKVARGGAVTFCGYYLPYLSLLGYEWSGFIQFYFYFFGVEIKRGLALVL